MLWFTTLWQKNQSFKEKINIYWCEACERNFMWEKFPNVELSHLWLPSEMTSHLTFWCSSDKWWKFIYSKIEMLLVRRSCFLFVNGDCKWNWLCFVCPILCNHIQSPIKSLETYISEITKKIICVNIIFIVAFTKSDQLSNRYLFCPQHHNLS